MGWKKTPNSTPYDAANYRPGWDDEDFGDKNARTKAMARFEFLDNVKKVGEEIHKLKESTDLLPGPLQDLYDGVSSLTEKLPTLWDKHACFQRQLLARLAGRAAALEQNSLGHLALEKTPVGRP